MPSPIFPQAVLQPPSFYNRPTPQDGHLPSPRGQYKSGRNSVVTGVVVRLNNGARVFVNKRSIEMTGNSQVRGWLGDGDGGMG